MHWSTYTDAGGVSLIYLCKKQYREKMIEESKYWEKCCRVPSFKSNFLRFSYLLARYPEYRNLFRYRLNSYSRAIGCLAAVMMLFLPKLSTLYLHCNEIGWNLYIQHGFATVIAAKSIGQNCWVNQQVTVGWSFDDEPPQIKNGVRICAGAKVVGKITIEDNAIIGTNAVVVKNVGQQDIVGGVPAKTIGKNDNHCLYENTK